MSTCWPARCPVQSGDSRTSVRTRGVSAPRSTTSAARQVSRPSIAAPAMGLRSCGSRSLPEAGLVLVPQREAAHPLRALPEVQVRDEQPRRAAVLGLQRLAVVVERHPRLAAGDVLHRQVGGVAAVAEREHVVGSSPPRRAACRPRRPPDGVELRPLRDAVDVLVTFSLGSARNSSHVQLFGSSPPPSTVNAHSASGVCGVGPAESTGKSSVRYCPGGTRSGALRVPVREIPAR